MYADDDPARPAPPDPEGRPEVGAHRCSRMPRHAVGRVTPVALAATVTLLAGGGYALASGGTAKTKPVTLCVQHAGGAVYRAPSCHRRDTKLVLAREGRTGLRGRTGARGW